MTNIFRIPKAIITGANSYKELANLPELLDKHNALLIKDNVKIEGEIESKIKEIISAKGISITEYTDVRESISHQVVNTVTELAKDIDADVIVAIGGRLAMHVCRLVSMLLTNGGKIEKFTDGDQIQNPSMTNIVLATTSSAGVAISTCVCYVNEELSKRFCFSNPSLLPTIAILDPVLTNWLSPQEIALDGVISLGYAIEAMASELATPVTDALASQAITGMVRWLPDVYTHSHKIEQREKLMFAQQLVSMSSSNVKANMVCKLAGQIEALTHIPMGNSVAALLPNVVDLLADIIPEKIKEMRNAILRGDDTLEFDHEIDNASNELRSILMRLDMPLQLSFLGFEESHIDKIIDALEENTLATMAPIPIDNDSIIELLRKSL